MRGEYSFFDFLFDIFLLCYFIFIECYFSLLRGGVWTLSVQPVQKVRLPILMEDRDIQHPRACGTPREDEPGKEPISE